MYVSMVQSWQQCIIISSRARAGTGAMHGLGGEEPIAQPYMCVVRRRTTPAAHRAAPPRRAVRGPCRARAALRPRTRVRAALAARDSAPIVYIRCVRTRCVRCGRGTRTCGRALRGQGARARCVYTQRACARASIVYMCWRVACAATSRAMAVSPALLLLC